MVIMNGSASTISYVDPEYVEPIEGAVAFALAKAKRRWYVDIRGVDRGIYVQAVSIDGRRWSWKLPLRTDTPRVLEGLLADTLVPI